MAAQAMHQELQNLIVQTLESNSTIPDTSKLALPSQPGTNVDQQLVQAVLTSLASRDVNPRIS